MAAAIQLPNSSDGHGGFSTTLQTEDSPPLPRSPTPVNALENLQHFAFPSGLLPTAPLPCQPLAAQAPGAERKAGPVTVLRPTPLFPRPGAKPPPATERARPGWRPRNGSPAVTGPRAAQTSPLPLSLCTRGSHWPPDQEPGLLHLPLVTAPESQIAVHQNHLGGSLAAGRWAPPPEFPIQGRAWEFAFVMRFSARLELLGQGHTWRTAALSCSSHS